MRHEMKGTGGRHGRYNALAVVALLLSCVALVEASELRVDEHGRQLKRQRQRTTGRGGNGNKRMAEDVAERLSPRLLEYNDSATTPWPTKQVVHLHHMKTGGTSVNGLLRCGMRRFETIHSTKVPFASLSECSGSYYKRCIGGEDEDCKDRIDSASVMTYCAPLFQVHEFGWLRHPNADDRGTGMITVLRNPIDRIWSMYRYQTRSCYSCIPLVQIYEAIDNGTIAEVFGCEDLDNCRGICIPQLINHQVRNLLTSPSSQGMSDKAQLREAIRNLRNEFAVIGLTEELNTTARLIGHAFPFMAETLEGHPAYEDGKMRRKLEENDALKCELPHANASPSNNRCGPDGTHWDLPPHPDEETLKAILKHNELDVKLYEKAVKYFQLEKKALGWE